MSRSDLSLKFTLLCELQEEQGSTKGKGALRGWVEARVPERRWLLVQVCVGVCVCGPRWRLSEYVWDLGQCALGVLCLWLCWAHVGTHLHGSVSDGAVFARVALYFQGCVCVHASMARCEAAPLCPAVLLRRSPESPEPEYRDLLASVGPSGLVIAQSGHPVCLVPTSA